VRLQHGLQEHYEHFRSAFTYNCGTNFTRVASGSGIGKKSRSGSGLNIPDHISESLEPYFGLKILKFFDVYPDPGSGIFLTLDPGWKNSYWDPG
jgi:hypothetical protein